MTEVIEQSISEEDVNINKFLMVLKSAANLPGVHINRNEFLKKELSQKFNSEIVEIAIEKNPAYAGIRPIELNKIATSCINYETTKVTGLSAVAGIPGGLAMLGTVPADVAQYFSHIIRILQKLIYLYGWPEIMNSNDLDDATSNELVLFIGVMFGVNAANAAIANLAKITAKHLEKTLLKKALTKGTIYPIIKKIAAMLGIKMTKEIFAKQAAKVVPVVGAIVSGSITYATYKPLAIRLKEHLELLPIADNHFYEKEDISNI